MAVKLEVKNKVLKRGIHYITSDYKTRNTKRPTHNGIDMVSKSGSGYVCDYIVAIEDGEVITSKYSSSAGYYVEIKHSNNVVSRYLHMKKGTVKVSKGDEVKKGDVIGYMGNTGNSNGAHLHIGIKEGKEHVDPRPYLTGEKTITKESEKSEVTCETIHIVKKGENLTKIAKKYGTTYQKIAKDNNIKNPNLIYPGQKLVIK